MISLSLAAVISRASLRASKPLAYQPYPGNMGAFKHHISRLAKPERVTAVRVLDCDIHANASYN